MLLDSVSHNTQKTERKFYYQAYELSLHVIQRSVVVGIMACKPIGLLDLIGPACRR